ncbi:CD033-like protein, partial [Mya arenaria]
NIIRTYNIRTTWDGQPVNHDPIKITVGPVEYTGHVMLSASGPFFNDTWRPPNSVVVVEVFFLNDENNYFQVILSPHGMHLVLLYKGKYDLLKDKLPMSYYAAITGPTWHGVAHIPVEYLPPKVSKFNSHASHGSTLERKHEALYPATAGSSRDT